VIISQSVRFRKLLSSFVADITTFGWVNAHARAGVDIEEFPNLKAWHAKLKARPGVLAGLDVPQKNKADDAKDPKELEKIAKDTSAWVMKGMEDDKKRS